jgi:hypothetical protein
MIHGTVDLMFPTTHGEALTEEVPDARLMALEPPAAAARGRSPRRRACGKPRCDRRAIGSLGDIGRFSACYWVRTKRPSRGMGHIQGSRSAALQAFILETEGEGFEPSTRLDDV